MKEEEKFFILQRSKNVHSHDLSHSKYLRLLITWATVTPIRVKRLRFKTSILFKGDIFATTRTERSRKTKTQAFIGNITGA